MISKIKLASSCRFGAYCALVAGISYSLIVCCAFFAPDSIASYVTSATYFEDFKEYRNIFVFLKWLMFIANCAMIGVVCTFYTLHRPENHGLMTWVCLMAIVGFGVGIFQSVEDLSLVPYLADQYEHGGQSIRDVIIALGVANPSIYIASLGLPGIWFIVVSWLARNNPEIPKFLVLLGFMWGIGNIMTVIAHVLIIIPLIRLVSYGALLFAPMWSIYEGVFLLKVAKKIQGS